jgi:methyltransferase (TIGR00027 family)
LAGPSRTAEFMALFRALESYRRPAEARLFEDPLAYGFLRRSLRLVVRLSQVPLAGRIVPWFIDRRWPGARTAAVARTRLIDDTLGQALAEVRQVVLLGSGFDSRPYRIQGMSSVRVFEVDHATTLDRKRSLLARWLGAPPPNVTFVAVDFDREELSRALESSGFDSQLPAFVIWEGVTSYLTQEGVDSTLRSLAKSAPGTRVLFTYLDRRVIEAPEEYEGGRRLAAIVRSVGEPWKFGFEPGELRPYLAERGLVLLDDVGAHEFRARYMGPERRNTKGYEFYRAALAEVGAKKADQAGAARP